MVYLMLACDIALVTAPVSTRAVKHAPVWKNIKGLFRIFGRAEDVNNAFDKGIIRLERAGQRRLL